MNDMMHDLYDKAVRSARIGLFFFLILAICLCSSGTLITDLSGGNSQADSRSGSPGQASLQLPDEAPGNMSPNGLPTGSQAAWIAFHLSPPVINGADQHRNYRHDLADIYQPQNITSSRSNLPASTGLVSSRLGRMFTLVGAKPSGTG